MRSGDRICSVEIVCVCVCALEGGGGRTPTRIGLLSQAHNGVGQPVRYGTRKALTTKRTVLKPSHPEASSVPSQLTVPTVTMSRAETLFARAYHDTARDSKRARALTPESVEPVASNGSSSSLSPHSPGVRRVGSAPESSV